MMFRNFYGMGMGMHPFGLFAGFGILALALFVIFLVIWIWAIVDAARRDFKNDLEKIIWILVLVFGGWIGLLVYLIVIKLSNPRGLMKK